jgi:hypothetical protein
MLTQAVFLLGRQGSGAGNERRGTSEALRPVGGVPFIRGLLDEVARFGVDDMVLIARGEAGALKPFLAENLDRPYRIRGVVAPQGLPCVGHVGGGALVPTRSQPEFMVVGQFDVAVKNRELGIAGFCPEGLGPRHATSHADRVVVEQQNLGHFLAAQAVEQLVPAARR